MDQSLFLASRIARGNWLNDVFFLASRFARGNWWNGLFFSASRFARAKREAWEKRLVNKLPRAKRDAKKKSLVYKLPRLMQVSLLSLSLRSRQLVDQSLFLASSFARGNCLNGLLSLDSRFVLGNLWTSLSS